MTISQWAAWSIILIGQSQHYYIRLWVSWHIFMKAMFYGQQEVGNILHYSEQQSQLTILSFN